MQKSEASPRSRLAICSGFGCQYREMLSFTDAQTRRLKAILRTGHGSAAAERKAIARAVAAMEKDAQRNLGFRADAPLSQQRHMGLRGQMDCYDESLNTRSFLQWMDRQGLLIHHRPLRRIGQRGILIDGRYPHKTALLQEKGGKPWAVDSWRGRGGEPPEIMPIDKWQNSDSSDFPYSPAA